MNEQERQEWIEQIQWLKHYTTLPDVRKSMDRLQAFLSQPTQPAAEVPELPEGWEPPFVILTQENYLPVVVDGNGRTVVCSNLVRDVEFFHKLLNAVYGRKEEV